MARPDTATAKEIIIPTFTQWEKVGSVTAILAELEEGQFYNAALLHDQFMRDDRLRAVWDIAIQAVLGMPMHCESADHTAVKRSDKVSDEADKQWPHLAPDAELVELLMWGFFLGAGVARKEWTLSPTGWTFRIKTWHAGALRYDLTTDRYMLRTADQGEIPIERGDPNWVLFTPFGHKYGRLRGYMRSLAMVVLKRSWGNRDEARHSEKHGEPFAQLVVPAEYDQKDKDNARRAAAALGSETVSITPQGQDGNKLDWKFHEPNKTSAEVFGPMIERLEDCLAILLLGQRSSTKGSAGLGSDANPGDVVRRDKMRFYAKCIGDLGEEQIFPDWARWNFGDETLAPRPVIEVDPPEDGQKRALELSTLGDAIDKLVKYGLDARGTLEDAGAKLLTPEAARQMQERQAMMPAPPDTETPDDGNDDDEEDGNVSDE